MGKPWEDYKEEIHDLYIKQNLPLKEVQEILKNKWGFDACKRAFQNQIEAWGFRKNVRSAEMQVYVQQKKLRKSDSEIDLPDETKKIITPRKARRFEKRSESMNTHKGTSLDLDPNAAAASAMSVVGQHHHHHHHHHHNQQTLHSPSYPQHRMSMGQGYSNFSPYPQDTMGYSPTFPSNPSSHDMPKYAQQGMTISLCDDANHGSFSLPVSKSPYDSAGYVNPAMTTAGTFAPMMSTEAPMYDLTDDLSFQNGMQYLPSGVVRKNPGNDFYSTEDAHFLQIPVVYNYTCAETQDSELLTLCFSGAVKDVKMLLDKGANPNAISLEGETALTCLGKGVVHGLQPTGYPAEFMIKYLGNYYRVLELLIRRGADPMATNRSGEHPLQILYAARDLANHPYTHEDVRKGVSLLIRLLQNASKQRGFSYGP